MLVSHSSVNGVIVMVRDGSTPTSALIFRLELLPRFNEFPQRLDLDEDSRSDFDVRERTAFDKSG